LYICSGIASFDISHNSYFCDATTPKASSGAIKGFDKSENQEIKLALYNKLPPN
jgi:hypothetical protein